MLWGSDQALLRCPEQLQEALAYFCSMAHFSARRSLNLLDRHTLSLLCRIACSCTMPFRGKLGLASPL